MPNSFIHGRSGKFLIGAQDFAVMEFDLDWSVTAEDITHTDANGYRVMLDGIESFTGTITFVYDTSNKPTVAPNQLKPRTQATVHLKPDGSDDFSAPILCTKFGFKSGPKAGAVIVTVTVESTGPITY